MIGGVAAVAASSAALFADPRAREASGGILTPPPAAAAATAEGELAPFVGKAGFFVRYPGSWVRAMDRPGGAQGSETLALVGNFKTIDTVSIRREPLSMHEDFVAAAARPTPTPARTSRESNREDLVGRPCHVAEREPMILFWTQPAPTAPFSGSPNVFRRRRPQRGTERAASTRVRTTPRDGSLVRPTCVQPVTERHVTRRRSLRRGGVEGVG